MARKSLNDAAASKLAQRQEGREDAPKLVAPRRAPRVPRSFRLRPADIDRLRDLTERLSKEAGRPINETDTIKGLLLLGEKTNPSKLIKAIKDAVFEGR